MIDTGVRDTNRRGEWLGGRQWGNIRMSDNSM
jgi:hypothetical protein